MRHHSWSVDRPATRPTAAEQPRWATPTPQVAVVRLRGENAYGVESSSAPRRWRTTRHAARRVTIMTHPRFSSSVPQRLHRESLRRCDRFEPTAQPASAIRVFIGWSKARTAVNIAFQALATTPRRVPGRADSMYRSCPRVRFPGAGRKLGHESLDDTRSNPFT